VRLDVRVVPLATPPFGGVASPEELATRMRDLPKAGARLLEGGAIAAWFATNGWPYPVPGKTACGIAAVQQFFEHLGLSKPPPLWLTDAPGLIRGAADSTAVGEITLGTDAGKWVYAEISSAQSWLRVVTSQVSGPGRATIRFTVNPGQIPNDVDAVTTLNVVGNGGQTLSTRITVRRTDPPPQTPTSWPGAIANWAWRCWLALRRGWWSIS
jgi:hypothetical protein